MQASWHSKRIAMIEHGDGKTLGIGDGDIELGRYE
jgi:hypothetical protein